MIHKKTSRVLLIFAIPLFTFLILFIGITSVSALTNNCFTDVTIGMWFHNYVCWMFDKGLTIGYPDGTFRPADPASRAEVAVFMHQISGEGSIGPIVDADKLDGIDSSSFATSSDLSTLEGRVTSVEGAIFSTHLKFNSGTGTSLYALPCDAGDTLIGGGCGCGGGETLETSMPTSSGGPYPWPTGWVCSCSASTLINAYTICLRVTYP